jgi:DNA invertase Pin-like site-specific DNA recombinase
MTKFVAYYRVSTQKQGASGLGIEAQQAAVDSFVKREEGILIAPPFTEVESGKNKDRPELNKAIAHARRNKAVLLVAKLDRLARNVSFLANLMEAGVDFVACDNPHATRLTIHILAAVAEEEARATSARTKAALKEAKKRGVKLGSAREGHWDGQEDRRKEGQKLATLMAAKSRALKFIKEIDCVIAELIEARKQGSTLRQTCELLNSKGHLTSAGYPWNPMAVLRAEKRFLKSKGIL